MFSLASINMCSPAPHFEQRLNAAVAQANTPVVCLQEVAPDFDLQAWAGRNGFTAIIPDREGMNPSYPAILSRTPVLESGSLPVVADKGRSFPWAVIPYRDKKVLVVSVHGAWGGTWEAHRLAENLQIEQLAADFESKDPKNSVSVIAGDFNAPRDSESGRFLRGLTFDHGTKEGSFWTEAGLGTPAYAMTTTRDDGQWGKLIAGSQGLTPGFAVLRRIDFIMVRGWRLGSPFTPTGFELFGDKTPQGFDVSDHWGVRTSFTD